MKIKVTSFQDAGKYRCQGTKSPKGAPFCYRIAAEGKYELFKTTAHFDSTAKHPDWLGGETEAIRKLAPGQS